MIIYYETGGIIKIEIDENKELKITDFPFGLTNLYLGDKYNKEIIKNILPSTLKKIIFGTNFNQEIYPNTLPCNMEYLEFGENFTKIIHKDILPSNLKYLIFRGNYKYILTYSTLPKNLIYLSFKTNKYEICENILPDTLLHLKLGYDYNFEFKKGVLPNKLKYLELGGIYSYSLANVPETLETLSICGSKENELLLNNLHPSIKNLIIYNLEVSLNNLPIGIESIKLICYNDKTLKLLKIPFDCKVFDRFNKIITPFSVKFGTLNYLVFS